MENDCNKPLINCQPVDVPTVDNTPDPCGCGYVKARCTVFTEGDEYLDLGPEATLLDVIEALKGKIEALEQTIIP